MRPEMRKYKKEGKENRTEEWSKGEGTRLEKEDIKRGVESSERS